MGIPFSCPFSDYGDMESVVVKSISFGGDEVKTQLRSVSFNLRNSEPAIISLGSGKMTIEGSISFKRRDSETVVSIKASSNNEKIDEKDAHMVNQSLGLDSFMENIQSSPIVDPNCPKHEAAVKLQKVYKSFRTRRKLADCAVLVEQSWWKVLDYAELKRSSVSFFDIEKHETPISRWSRARTRAAKVGKGLAKDNKAQKLALQHWLEAIDPRHRYGHNLHFYYTKWLHCQSREPFFYWLDIGEGKEVNLVDKCSRSKLQQQCIKYLGPMERMTFEVVLEDGKFLYKKTGELLHTIEDDADAKWIFVLSTSKTLYVGKKKKGTFQHSSFLSGGATSAAGRLAVENGILKAVWPHSGHYQPTEENFKDFLSFLRDNNVDLTDVKMSPVDEEEGLLRKQRSIMHLRHNSSEEDLNELEINVEDLTQKKTDSTEIETEDLLKPSKSSHFQSLNGRPINLQIVNVGNFKSLESEVLTARPSFNNFSVEAPADGYETEDNAVHDVPQESILHRINSHKETKSYQLGKQLSCKWTTGAGPRISCVRDYPSGLQFRALEQVSLSPRSVAQSRSHSSRSIS